MLLLREFTEDSPNEVDMTHLPTGPRKGTFSGGLYPLMSVRDNQVHLIHFSLLQLGEDILPGQLILALSDSGSQNLPESIIPDPGNDQECLAGISYPISDLEIRGIYEEIGE